MIMTQEEAEALAAKREAHKGKSLYHKTWKAVHDPVKGWHAALVDNGRSIDIRARAMKHRGNGGPAPNLVAVATAIEVFGIVATIQALRRIASERGE
jgi:hypothetical protein